jgi:glycosyltransferase involved in cell wall biosynthesis
MRKLPVSAVIVCFNEGHLLEACLQSVQFCEEVLVVDLGSSDDSPAIAARYATTLAVHEHVPVVEQIRKWSLDKVKHDWLLFIDPDERIDAALAEELRLLVPALGDEVAAVSVPWQFYYAQKRLRGTFWGSPDAMKTILVHRWRVIVPKEVHRGYAFDEQRFRTASVARKGENLLHHYWMSNYSQLLDKHRRYLRQEGEAKYKQGWRYRAGKQYKHFLTAFYDSFIIYQGWRDGATGLGLSLFYAWYNFKIWSSLKQYETIQSAKA